MALAGVLALAGTAQAMPAAPARPHGSHSTSRKASAQADAFSRASTKARATGKSIVVDAATTPTSTTSADPSGTFTIKQTIEPTRVWKNGAWKGLDATLLANADHTLSPVATTSGLSLSGGGSGPLATMDDAGRRLSLSWPTPLPAPTVNGDTITYANVLDDVDLVVTATPQGGFSHVLVVKTAEAAKDPGLATLTMATQSTGLTVAADAAGDLYATAGPAGLPVFSAQAPTMWDSAVSTPPSGTRAAAGAKPAASSHKTPGTGAHTAKVKATLTPTGGHGNIHESRLTLTPDQAMLTSSSTVFPVYIDPAWVPLPAGSSRQAWAQTDTINKSAAHWKPTELQNGYCGWDTCVPTFTAESYVRMSVPAQLQGAQIYTSELDLTVAYGPYSTCSSAPTPGLQLWWTGGISSGTTWNNAPSWLQNIDTQNPHACSGQNVGFPLTSFMQSHAQGNSSLTFGIKAASETSRDGWKQFNASTLKMSTTYDRAPRLPTRPSTSPGGPCQTGNPATTVIGNDDITFETVATDPDGGQLDTEFTITDYNGAIVYPTTGSDEVTSTSGGVVRLVLTRDMIHSWHPDNAAHAYSWYTRTTDGKLSSPTTGTGSAGTPCNFTVDPAQPPSPAISLPIDGTGQAGSLGQTMPLTLAPCQGALQNPPATCTGAAPDRYVYQVNSNAPLSVPATGGVQTVQVPLHHVGLNAVTVFALSAGGNTGQIASGEFTVARPSTAYADGDIDGDHHADLLATGTGANPGLWLAAGDGAGHVNTPTDIGAAGTGLFGNGGPADWNGPQILHGDFTGNRVQDVMAYYPTGSSAGVGSIVYGTGDDLPLNPADAQRTMPADQLVDYTLNQTGDFPATLVAAGDASLTATGIADLIGISGDPTGGYQLDLYTTCGGCSADGYTYTTTLAGPADSPDGLGDWNNFTLATAQPSGKTVLFALKKTTGELWESTNPAQNPATPIGTPVSSGGTWTKITTTWSPTPATVYGDVNTAGSVELWAQTGTTAKPYTLAGTALQPGTAVSLLVPTHEWPLTDGTGTSAVDTRGGGSATLSPAGASWIPHQLGNRPVLGLDGTSGYLKTPDGLISASTSLTVSLSFQANLGTHGILLSTGHDVPSALNTATMPIMYIGTDGRLYAQFWNGMIRPMTSPERVDDGQWHTATLTANGNVQSLFLDNDLRIGMAGSPTITNQDPQTYAGAGVFPADTATKKWLKAPGNSTQNRTSYFTGKIANLTYFNKYLTPAQISAYNQPAPITGPITSLMSTTLCIDDNANGSVNYTKIQIWSCNKGANQQFTIVPDNNDDPTNTITINGKCVDLNGSIANNTPIVLYTCSDSAGGQKWQLSSDNTIYNPYSGLCLEIPGASTTNGTQLDIWTCNSKPYETWVTP